MKRFMELTAAQEKVFEQIAIGNDKSHNQRTLNALERKELIVSHREWLPGLPPCCIKRYEVPIDVHIAWCTWCEEHCPGAVEQTLAADPNDAEQI